MVHHIRLAGLLVLRVAGFRIVSAVLDHPSVVRKRLLAFTQSAAGMIIPSNEVEQEEGEKKGYDSVADSHTSLEFVSSLSPKRKVSVAHSYRCPPPALSALPIILIVSVIVALVASTAGTIIAKCTSPLTFPQKVGFGEHCLRCEWCLRGDAMQAARVDCYCRL